MLLICNAERLKMLPPPAAPSTFRGGKPRKHREIKVYVLGQPRIKQEDAAAGAAKTFSGESLGRLMANQ